MKRLRIGVLASGGGTNLQSIIDKCLDGTLSADVVVVISNNSKAGALERAHKHGIDTVHVSSVTEGSQEAVDRKITEEMISHSVDLVVLAGYMKKIGPVLLKTYEDKILNIHPALLPKFGGKDMYGMLVHEAVVDAGEKESGATVHIVDGKYDHGKIIEQKRVPVFPDDTPETLRKRVLVEEQELFPKTLQKMAEQWNH